MKIISEFNDFYDSDYKIELNNSLVYNRFTITMNNEEFNSFRKNLGNKKVKDILDKYYKWSINSNVIMTGLDNSMILNYHVVGIYPKIYLIPIVTIINNKSLSLVDIYYDDINLPFSTEKLEKIGNKYNMSFISFKGKGLNKKPIHKIILRKIPNIETSYFFLKEYISPDDIIINSVDELVSKDCKDLFKEIKSPIFYMTEYNNFIDKDWKFSLNPNISLDIKYLNLNLFDDQIYNRVETFFMEDY